MTSDAAGGSGRLWRIGELADATGVTVRTLHHYEQLGLLRPSTRTSGGHRLYDEQDVRGLYRVRALRGLGLSLIEVRDVLGSADTRLTDLLTEHMALDHLGIDAAHVLGASLGGAIAQTIAIEHPERVLSLSSLMSTTGDPSVGQIHPATAAAIFGGPPVSSRRDVVDRALRTFGIVGSPAYPTDPADVAARAGRAYDRGYDEAGVARTAVASIASGDRTARLRTLDVPTLVVHGLADTMADPGGGRATAAAVPGAELVLIDGMGHDIAPGLWDLIADRVCSVVERGEARRAAPSALA